jgi:formate/nitrite transporter
MEKRFLTPPETINAIIANGRRVLAQSLGRTFVLSLLAGFYISFGAQLATVVTSDAAAHLGSGVARLLGGSVFSIGLMMVVVCGAELFTGNSFLASSVLDGEISLTKMLENWGVVIVGNLLGAIFFAWMMAESRLWESGAVGEQTMKIASLKCNLSFWVAFIRGVLCNWLVCLAVFMATAARDIPGKLLACYMPIMAFVASGFEHNVANMYFIPSGLLIKGAFPAADPGLTWANFLIANLIPVTLGNIVGGVLFVASAYWYVHSGGKKSE